MQNKTLQIKRALRTALFVLLLCVVGMGKGYAYDFSAVCETGQTLYYNIIDAEIHHVALTCPGTPNNNSCWSGFTQPTGEITLPETVQHDGITYSVTSIDSYAFCHCSDLTGNITIPNSVTTIGDYAFSNCYQLTGDLIIPNSVVSIGYYAFGYCDGFTGSLIIGNSVTSIGEKAFKHCFCLTCDLIIPNSVTSIGHEAFSFCRKLTSTTIPNSVTYIGENPFMGCKGLEQIIVESGNPVYDSRGNCNAIIKTSTNQLISGCKNSIIPNSVTSIGEMAFWSIDLPAITIPNSVIYIYEDAFSYCTQLTSITIPNSVIGIHVNPFSGCSGLEQITVEPGNPIYDSRDNCNAIINTITNELVSGCKNSIIPNSVTSIGIFAFVNCTSLSSITIPSSIISISSQAFSNCSGLTSITVLSETPPSLSSSVFNYVPKEIPVFVPSGTIEAYKAAFGWNEFTHFIDIENNYEIIATADPEEGGTIIGAGFYNYGEEVTLRIIPNLNYVFDGWAENNTIVSHDETFSFIATMDRNLVAKLTHNASINEQNGFTVSFFPNPTNGQILIEAEGLKYITISNLLGQTIYEGNASGDEFNYDFSEHETGIYLIRIETASGMAVKKVSVTR